MAGGRSQVGGVVEGEQVNGGERGDLSPGADANQMSRRPLSIVRGGNATTSLSFDFVNWTPVPRTPTSLPEFGHAGDAAVAWTLPARTVLRIT